MATTCQYEALRYVSFPTQTLAKTAKMIPVMVAFLSSSLALSPSLSLSLLLSLFFFVCVCMCDVCVCWRVLASLVCSPCLSRLALDRDALDTNA